MNSNDYYFGDGTIWYRKDTGSSVVIQHRAPDWLGECYYLVESEKGRKYMVRESTLRRRYRP